MMPDTTDLKTFNRIAELEMTIGYVRTQYKALIDITKEKEIDPEDMKELVEMSNSIQEWANSGKEVSLQVGEMIEEKVRKLKSNS